MPYLHSLGGLGLLMIGTVACAVDPALGTPAISPSPAGSASELPATTRDVVTRVHSTRFQTSFTLAGNGWRIVDNPSDTELLALHEGDGAQVMFAKWTAKQGTSSDACEAEAAQRGLIPSASIPPYFTAESESRRATFELVGERREVNASGIALHAWVVTEGKKSTRGVSKAHVFVLGSHELSCIRVWYEVKIAPANGSVVPSAGPDDQARELGIRLAEIEASLVRTLRLDANRADDHAVAPTRDKRR